jgi:hypothetical protein
VRVNCSLLCQGANITADGLLNLVGGGITQVTATAFPISLVNIFLALSFTADGHDLRGDHTLIFTFSKRPNAQQASQGRATFSAETPPEPGLATAPLVLPLAGVVLPDSGEYDIPIDLDGDRIADLFLRAKLEST